jgi:hypothetical protein
MDHMIEDDRIDEILRTAASDYNRPPATPSEEMWTAIQAARTSSGPKLHVVSGGVSTPSEGYSARRSFGTRYTWMGMAAAAVLLVATGVGIGRLTTGTSTPALSENPVRVVATAPVTTTEPATAATPDVSTSEQPKTRSPEEIRNSPRIIGTRTLRPLPGSRIAARNGSGLANGSSSNIYHVATVRHLADAEAMLTSFSLGSRDASMNAQFAGWAKGLLSNTRLLLDSPAGDDPRRAKLLQDLELVLAQIVQLSPNAAAEDRELIQGSIQQGHVMTRLRTAIPASDPRGILER